MLRGGLEALRAREEALRTAQTLDADLARKRTRAEQLQATSHPKAVRSPPFPHCLPEHVAQEVPRACECAAGDAGTHWTADRQRMQWSDAA